MRLAADNALNTHTLHQPCHRASGNIEAFPTKLTPDLAHAVDTPVLFEDTPDLRLQRRVAPGTLRLPIRIGPLRQVIVIGGRGDRQNLANRLDPMLTTMIVDEPDHHFDRRSSSAIAKYALALRKISLAWRSSRFSRSSAFVWSFK